MMIRVGKEWADAVVIGYPLNARRPVRAGTFAQGVTSSDFIYYPHARPLEQWRSRQ